MATEKLLVKTKDNCVLAFDITFSNEAERLRLVHECENIGANLNYRNNETPTYSSAITPDDANTKFLNQEISGYHYRKNRSRFSNRMRRDPPVQPNTLYISHQINDDAFPEMIKNLGFEIKPVDKHYRVHYNPATQEFDPEPEFVKTVMSVNSGKRMVSVVRNHFQFEPQDYRLLENIIQKYKRAQQTNAHLSEDEFIDSLPDKKSRRLFRIYSAEVDRNHDRQTSINHELKHIANSIFMAGLSLKKDNKRLQIEDYYRIAMEDERSAYLGELVDNINTYLKNGNFDDFSMFTSNNSRCVVELKRLRTPAERQAYAMNWPHLVAQKMAYFEEEQRAFYDGNQIPRNLQIYADKAPIA